VHADGRYKDDAERQRAVERLMPPAVGTDE